jgi:tRNA-specific 2-thiouridylase
VFPLGGWTKEDVKKWSTDHNLPIVPRGESQDLCFVEEGMYPEFVEARVPEVKKKGRVLDVCGRQLAEHDGIHRFTVGQRGGTGVAVGERVYVSRIDADKNEIVLSPREGVMQSECFVQDAHWITGLFPECRASVPLAFLPPEDPPAQNDRDGRSTFTVQPRYGHRGAAAVLEKISDTDFKVSFAEPQFALTPGQAAVVYDGDELLGGGWIR